MYTAQELQPLIIEWANERGLIKPENAPKQHLKLIEEAGEIAAAILKNDIQGQKDAIGDMFVVLVIFNEQLKYPTKILLNKVVIEYGSGYNHLLTYIISEPTSAGNYSRLLKICENLQYDFTECINLAWNSIKDRKGQTVNGTFIKASE